jgi:hypothetical protein
MSKLLLARGAMLACAAIAAASTGAAQVGLLELADAPRTYELLEFHVAPAGDVDGDGFPDTAVGRPFDEQGWGSVALVSGRTGLELWKRRGIILEDSLGECLDAGGDLDHDGVGDVVALQALRMPIRGYALAAFRGTDGTSLWRTLDAREDFETLRFVGDLDGDGTRDLLCGTPFASNVLVYTGRVALRSGANGVLLYERFGAGSSDYLGMAATALEDLNGDGTLDYAVGAPMAHPPQDPTIGRGYVWIFSGRSGGALRRIDGPAASGGFGTALARLGDLDGDGFGELCVGAPYEPPGGAAYVVSTATGTILRRFSSSTPNAELGLSVARLADLDHDGKDELAISAPGEALSTGVVRIYSGASGAELAQIRGDAAERIGTEIVGAHDVSGDGAEDLWLSVERTLPLPDLQRLSSPRDSTRFGAGCRAASPAPLLEVSSLRLGSTAQLVGTHAPANAAGCALMSLRPSASLALDAHCTLYLDLGTQFELARIASDATGSVALAIPVPPDPWLAGLEVALQLGWSDAGSALGFALTQAVYGALEG